MSTIKALLRKIRKIKNRLFWRTSVMSNKIEIDDQMLEEAIRSSGVKEGDIIFVHSSLSALGYVVGGPASIVDVLMKIISDKGTILMPTYPFQGSMHEHLSSNPTFNVSTDKSYMGAITEIFRTKTEFRSFHPTHSVSAWGNDAKWFIENHHQDDSPFGKNSPFYKTYLKGGKVLCIGSSIGQVTIYHIVEELTDFPKNVYLQEKYEARVVPPDNQAITVISKAHDPSQSNTRIDNDANTREYLEQYFSETGCVGNCGWAC